MGDSLRWIGHSTVLVELDGVRLLTDPLLRERVVMLRRSEPLVLGSLENLDASPTSTTTTSTSAPSAD